MDDELPTLENLAWCVLRMRDAQKSFEKEGNVFIGRVMRACEAAVDEMVSRVVLPPLPFEHKGGQQ